MSQLNVQPVGDRSDEKTPKPTPDLQAATGSRAVTFQYRPSPDGSDSNILIFFHGLGDTHVPFFRLGQSLNLPQTAILSLRGPKRVPLLEEDAFSWYPSFDSLGERIWNQVIQNPDPSETLQLVTQILNHLVDIGWPRESIHLFGFGQGGSIAVEAAYRYSSSSSSNSNSNSNSRPLGSVVSINGPLLSFPSLNAPTCTTPCLLWHRPQDAETRKASAAFKKAFANFKEELAPASQNQGMPRNQAEWTPIMKFWSEHLRRLQPWAFAGGSEDTYEVV